MNKTRQQQLTRWLKQQSVHARRWLRLSFLLGLASALLIIAQAWLLASLLHQLIALTLPRTELVPDFLLLLSCFIARAVISWLRERVGFYCGLAIRRTLRKTVLDRLDALGPAWIQGQPAGSWATLLLEQIEEMQDYYARYLPQMSLAALIPCFILIAIFPINWAAGVILLVTAPLIPLFMALVGMGAADANRRNFLALSRLSGHFLDRLRGLETLRLFHRAAAETDNINSASESFRQRTMEVLRLAFLSSAVLEFFASLSIAIVAVYFGFSYLGELNFGHYATGVTLFAGFLVLILAPEFFQPLRDLGTFYHAKAQAVGAADALHTFLSQTDEITVAHGSQTLSDGVPLTFSASQLVILSPAGSVLAGPLTFTLQPGQRVALVGQSGAGKSSLLNVLSGFLPYQGSLTVNGIELRELNAEHWQQQLAWVGQNPQLPAMTLRDNLPSEDTTQLQHAIQLAGADEFLAQLPQGLDTETGEHAARLSVGQAQRVAVARALLKPARLMLLDEPGASLDSDSERHVMHALVQASHQQTTLLVTHQLNQLTQWDEIWVMRQGQLIQQGCWDALVAQDGPFAELLSQRQGAIE
ncbi:heme ABC transporter permease/ATP-binding protein CydD [Winslowiella iniecta]|uniref:ABC-type xenobiotic transporter n=1 Tax=Winslowiella iniecta TaxID=1560201 RepID=A0A0L7TBL8_9GAMM|nr:cysteine/glutathione ABC transporter permease/ATP-binding protein CydD [Winslowiella iniecta]KOC92774.1 amino acid ABC transporter permease [Winslowiella iniecta]KOC95305.1 amino acid ABC transporter permease [Winslowiella iniecta]